MEISKEHQAPELPIPEVVPRRREAVVTQEPSRGLDLYQEEAVSSPGPVVVVAGPGTGKTRTLAHRVARLVQEGVPPGRIAAVTFTNRAAGEMRERVLGLA
ncbi:MAG TPA: ATP-dependent DNA helicase, partial [Candidatus Latescibacteria bacterium]|nr:ATP-dependent DNA helicase [Candidatus Latescibacterota bacterium]